MKRLISMAAAVVLTIGLAATPSMAADATASVDFASAYVWRGMTFNDGTVIQPSIDVATESGLGINVWGNFDIGDYDDSLTANEFSEVDLTISYGKSIGSLDVGVGVIEYLFPVAGGSTREAYLSLGYGLPAGFGVALDIYYDFDEVHDYYATFGISYALDISEKMGLEAGASVGYAGEDFAEYYTAGADLDKVEAGLYNYSVSVALGYTINDAWSASASVNLAGAMDSDNLPETDDGGFLDTTSYAVVGIAYAF